MKYLVSVMVACCTFSNCYCWGFFAHEKINYYAVFLLPPQMLVFYKPHLDYIREHATYPDKRRYMVAAEGPRHYIDIDTYGKFPYPDLPRRWNAAVEKFTEDSLTAHGIVPWWIQTMLQKLTSAFKERNGSLILKLSAELGHYIADAHVPLHACHNHNGQFTGQKGIHGLWESRVPELLADKEWDFFIGKADFLSDPGKFIWTRVLESAAAADTVLRKEREVTVRTPTDQKYAFELRNGNIIRQYASTFSKAYDLALNGMVERRMRMSIYSIASFWYSAWVNAGQPDLHNLSTKDLSPSEQQALDSLHSSWRKAGEGTICE